MNKWLILQCSIITYSAPIGNPFIFYEQLIISPRSCSMCFQQFVDSTVLIQCLSTVDHSCFAHRWFGRHSYILKVSFVIKHVSKTIRLFPSLNLFIYHVSVIHSRRTAQSCLSTQSLCSCLSFIHKCFIDTSLMFNAQSTKLSLTIHYICW